MAKLVVVTGAGRGIGRAIAEAFGATGAHVVLAARTAGELDETANAVRLAGGEATALPCDVAAEPHVRRLIDIAAGIQGSIDVLVANAGVAKVQPFHEQTLADWEATLRATLTGAFLLLKHAVSHMPPGSQIFTIGSIASRTAFPGWAAYTAAKWGLLGFTNAVREELRPRGIRVTAVLPGAVNTVLWDEVAGDWNRANMLQPADVARAIVHAAGEPAHVSIDELVLSHQAGRL